MQVVKRFVPQPARLRLILANARNT